MRACWDAVPYLAIRDLAQLCMVKQSAVEARAAAISATTSTYSVSPGSELPWAPAINRFVRPVLCRSSRLA